VIMGRIIPAGTGFPKYRNYEMVSLDKAEELPPPPPPPIDEEELLEGATT
jgi:hypothetical protein